MATPSTSTPAAPAGKTLTLDEAKKAIKDVVAAFDEPTNAEKMKAAIEEAGGDLMKMMQHVLPIAIQIQQSVIEKYGFTPDQAGVAEFSQAIRAHSKDEEVSKLTEEMKSRFMPKM